MLITKIIVLARNDLLVYRTILQHALYLLILGQFFKWPI